MDAKPSRMKIRDEASYMVFFKLRVVPPSGQGTKCPSLYTGTYFLDKRLKKDFKILHSLYFYHKAFEDHIKKFGNIRTFEII